MSRQDWPSRWRSGPLSRAGLLDLRVGRRAAARLRALAEAIRGLAPDRAVHVALHGSRALGLGRRGSDYDLAVVVDGMPSRGFPDDVGDLCLPHALEGFLVHAIAIDADRPGDPARLDGVARDGIAIEPDLASGP